VPICANVRRIRIFISPNAKVIIYNTNIISKHRGGFQEGQTSIVLDTLSNAEYNIKYLKNNAKGKKQYTIHYRSTLTIYIYVPMSLNVFYLLYPA